MSRGRGALTALTALTALAVLGAALVGCSDGADQGVSRGSLAWTTCPQDDRAQCATLDVPIDRSVTGGPTMALAIIRYRATAPSQRIGALLVNPGGPGASGKQFLLGQPFTAPLTQRFDLVSWDPRGVGDSSPLRCGGQSVRTFLADDPSPDDAAEQTRIDDDARVVALRCEQQDRAAVGHLGTRDTVEDIDAIRAALGEETISYVGFSYGTLYGLRYAEAHPDRLRAWVSDGVVDPTEDLEAFLVGQTGSFQLALERALDACRDQPSCPLGGDPMARATELATKVEAAPLDDHDGGSVATVGPAELSAGYVEALYDPADWPRFWSAIAQGLDGDGTGLGRFADEYYDFDGFTAYAATTCVDVPHPVGAAEFATFAARAASVSPLLGPGIANEMLPCAFWPAPVTGSLDPVAAPDAPPSLVLGRTGDPATPYESSVRVAAALRGAHLVTSIGDGHTSYTASSCVRGVVDRYLISLEVPAADPHCS